MANGREPLLENLWIKLLEEKAGGKYDFSFETAFEANEILKLSQTVEFNSHHVSTYSHALIELLLSFVQVYQSISPHHILNTYRILRIIPGQSLFLF